MLTTRSFALRCAPTTHPPDCPFLPHVLPTSYMQNGLQLNSDKSEALIIGSAHQLRAATSTVSSDTVADVDLPLSNEMKVLGVILDRQLTFKNHVSAVARSCNYHNQAIRHIRYLQTTQLAQTLACSVILSKARLVQRCAPRHSIRQHPEATACSE